MKQITIVVIFFVASIVCSDSKSGQSEDDTSFNELPLTPSTHAEDILKAYSKAQKENKRFIIFSTYQSAQIPKKPRSKLSQRSSF